MKEWERERMPVTATGRGVPATRSRGDRRVTRLKSFMTTPL
jgi:hypothetical protein